VRDLKENPGSIARLRVASNCAPMCEISQQTQCRLNNAARSVATEMGDEPDAAPIVLEPWIVQALRGRQTPDGVRRHTVVFIFSRREAQ
jgi:hypothetical protein